MNNRINHGIFTQNTAIKNYSSEETGGNVLFLFAGLELSKKHDKLMTNLYLYLPKFEHRAFRVIPARQIFVE